MSGDSLSMEFISKIKKYVESTIPVVTIRGKGYYPTKINPIKCPITDKEVYAAYINGVFHCCNNKECGIKCLHEYNKKS